MSAINTNGINSNYPVPGINNNTQGFRDNFATIKTNLDTASTELTDLQSKVIVKSALSGSSLNNDMANTLISNALVKSFRATTYNLGNSLSGTVTIDLTKGDVQYGTVSANTTIQFAGWAPTGTQSNVQLQLNVSNANAVVSLPNTVALTGTFGVETIENFANVANVPTLTAPNGVSKMAFNFSTIDCGANVMIEPVNRPRKTTQISVRTPANIGSVGDRAGTTCVDSSYMYVCTGNYDGSTAIWKRISLSSF